jgi:hypothetical protein
VRSSGTRRVQTDNLQAEIGYALFLQDYNKAEGFLADGYALWETLSPRSPYTWFNLKYLEIALLLARKHKSAIDVLDEYLLRWEEVPQLFYLARLKLLRIEQSCLHLRSPSGHRCSTWKTRWHKETGFESGVEPLTCES